MPSLIHLSRPYVSELARSKRSPAQREWEECLRPEALSKADRERSKKFPVHIINFMIFMFSTWLYCNRFFLYSPFVFMCASERAFSALKHSLASHVCMREAPVTSHWKGGLRCAWAETMTSRLLRPQWKIFRFYRFACCATEQCKIFLHPRHGKILVSVESRERK